jgi:hypothetical protein
LIADLQQQFAKALFAQLNERTALSFTCSQNSGSSTLQLGLIVTSAIGPPTNFGRLHEIYAAQLRFPATRRCASRRTGLEPQQTRGPVGALKLDQQQAQVLTKPVVVRIRRKRAGPRFDVSACVRAECIAD